MPGQRFERLQFGPNLRPLKDTVVGDLGETLWLLMGTIGLLLLIACANVANLVLVRTQSRRPELAMRTALGAGWAAIARVVLAESAILGLAGGVAGVAVAYFSLPFLLSLGARRPAAHHDGEDRPHGAAGRRSRPSALATLVFALIPLVQLCRATTAADGSLRGGAGDRDGGTRGQSRAADARWSRRWRSRWFCSSAPG